MKRIAKIAVIMLLVFLMSPLAVFAAPKGYKEVTLTKKNFSKYFEVVKMKHYDEFGDYNGYSFILKSKLLKKKYYLYETDDYVIKTTTKERYKYKYRKKTYKNTWKFNSTSSWVGNSIMARYSGKLKYDYKYAKLKSFKVKKAKGKLVFIEPSNVKGIKRIYDDDGKYDGSIIMLKYPYIEYPQKYHTSCETHWDDDKDKYVVDYYYMHLNDQNIYYNGKSGVKGETIVR